MSYDDGRVACTDDALVIRGYYFPWGDKRLPYQVIAGVQRRPMGVLSGKWRIWGSGDFTHWFNFDPNRPGKNVALIITLAGRATHPVITPDNPDAVSAELEAHGIPVSAQ